MTDPRPPAQIPTAERRDLVVQKLTQAFTAGRIELEDFELRTERAMRAQTTTDLDAVLDGLSAKAVVPAQNTPASGEFAIDRQRRSGARLTFAMMSGTDRKGRWTPSRRHVAVAWMGGAHLDFREAVLQPGVTDVFCYTMWGGIEIAVPPGLDVEVSGAAIMGGLSRVAQESGSTDPRRPRLHIHAFALMGGIEVRSIAPGTKWEEDEDEEESEGDA